jgi:hypothetical protein
VDREAYELDLSKRRAEHLARVMAFRKARSRGEPEAPAAQTPAAKWQPCKHDACLACHGTGIKVDDTTCIHTYICACDLCDPMHLKPGGYLYHMARGTYLEG